MTVQLSIIWPYQVVQELFLACVRNKNQFRAIVPILSLLGNLCTFRKSSSCSSLLLTVMRDTVTMLFESNDLLVNQNNIAQFIKGCLFNASTLWSLFSLSLLTFLSLTAIHGEPSHHLDSKLFSARSTNKNAFKSARNLE